nr:protein TORNADO 2 [Ipomoea batatas]
MATTNNNNIVVGCINFTAMLLSIPIIASGIWLSSHPDNLCVNILQWPLIIIGVIVLVNSLAGVVAGFWRIGWLLIFYFVAMLAVIVLLGCLVGMVYWVTLKGSGHPEPSRTFLEYRLEDYSGELRRWVQKNRKWDGIRSCLRSSSMCAELNQNYRLAQDFFNAHITPLQSGCCKPPHRMRAHICEPNILDQSDKHGGRHGLSAVEQRPNAALLFLRFLQSRFAGKSVQGMEKSGYHSGDHSCRPHLRLSRRLLRL